MIVYKLTGYDRTSERLEIDRALTRETLDRSPLVLGEGAVRVDKAEAQRLAADLPHRLLDRCDWFVEPFAQAGLDVEPPRKSTTGVI